MSFLLSLLIVFKNAGYGILHDPILPPGPRVKHQIDECMWNGFDFYCFLDRIIRIFFACGKGLFGRRPPNPKDPVDPVQLFFF